MSQPADVPAAEPANTLILSSPATAGSEFCIDNLAVTDPADTVALLVTYPTQDSPKQWVQSWEQYTGDKPAHLNVIQVGDFTRSAASATTTPAPQANGITPVETVNSPRDLAGLGIVISEFLGQWETERWTEEPSQIVVCFDSLTTLLQYVDLQQAFRFLHVLCGRLASVDAVAHFHLDPAAHDDQTITTLRHLFDTVIEDTTLSN